MGVMFDHVRYFPFVVLVGCVRSKAYDLPLISNGVAMYVLVKGDVFEFIVRGLTKNSIVLCESCQEWF